MFVNAVDKSSLPKIEKFTQLKSLLIGEAGRQIRSLTLSDANYDIAWSSLQERYENNRELMFSIIRRLINQTVVTNPTANSIRSLVDTTKECIRSLQVLSLPTDHWDAILLFILFSKMDNTSREMWEQSLPDTKIPSLTKMYDFLEQRARALAASTATNPSPRAPPTIPRPPPPSTGRLPPPRQHGPTTRTHHTTPSTCKLGCNSPHPVFKCPKLDNLTPQQRLDRVIQLKLCQNCLSYGHETQACASLYTCKVCKQKHHTILHVESSPNASARSTVGQHFVQPPEYLRSGILATARVKVVTADGNHDHRAFLDNGSINTYITEKSARLLGLPLHPCNIPMTGMEGSSVGTAKYVTQFSFIPYFNSTFCSSVTALVVKKITGNIPTLRLPVSNWTHLNNIQLADPLFHSPASVEILFGTDVFWSILEDGKIVGEPGQPIAVKSSLGWLIGGFNNTSSSIVTSFNTTTNLDQLLQRFWEQESVLETDKLTNEETACEEHFQSTFKRDKSGRFVVKLPFKQPANPLGASRHIAVKQFQNLERKYSMRNNKSPEEFRKLTDTWSQYKEFIKEYIDLGHMKLVSPADPPFVPNPYYIPHHCVLKESSTTTKLRVVFNASTPTASGPSLNQTMLAGPQLQDPLLEIMMRFRMNLIAFTADIAKMYRQIMVANDHTDYQRIVWRNSPSEPLRDYRLLTVTYGTTAAPYLAIKCLQTLATEQRQQLPEGAIIALNDFYVDDAASGRDSVEDAHVAVHQLINLCMAGCFELRKWTTNSPQLLDSIPPHLRETSTLVDLQHDPTVKTLGVHWNPVTDQYHFTVNIQIDMPGSITKRSVLSAIAKIFDPLGLLAPVIIVCKIFMQSLWQLKLGWDTELPPEVQREWTSIQESLQQLTRISIPRCVRESATAPIELVGACDASIKAISAVVYICTTSDTTRSCHVLTSKTRVAPLKHTTLPRLELNGAVLLSELMESVCKALKRPIHSIKCFSDSTIALHWIKSDPLRWKPYIRRRVQAIQDNLPDAQWFHIPGERNPADCASRGIHSSELLNHPLWWNGVQDFFTPPSSSDELIQDEQDAVNAESSVRIHHAQPSQLHPLFFKFSSFRKFQRVLAYVFRFIRNWSLQKRQLPLKKGTLTVTELEFSKIVIVRTLQSVMFPEEYECLKKNVPLKTTSRLLSLNPFIQSKDGLLRVGGRLRNAEIPFNSKHPILLPNRNHVTTTIVSDYHNNNFHSGPSATLSSLQHNYWIVNGRDVVRNVTRKCVVCRRHQAQTMKQIMGDLPYNRVNPARPFSNAGVDYAGPFSIRPMVRSRVTLKCWLSIFICFSTRAIHVEVVSSLSTDCFLAALRRFISRRGIPTNLYSDCGTNFKGADRVLREFYEIFRQDAVQEEIAKQNITWHFNPAGAPHFGGLWEAGVRSIKYHLYRVMGSGLLTYEEFLTLVVQIEGILNSRPIVAASSDPSDITALTPAHFLIGSPINSLPEPNLTETKQSRLKRWQLLQQQKQLFWKRWSNEYVSRLQQRPKWCKVEADLTSGSMVLVKDERLPPMKWRLGRVVNIHPGRDGHVRVATVKTVDGEIVRPITKLCLLPIVEASSNQSISPTN